MEKIEMVDLKGQYQKIKQDVDQAIASCIESAAFINGPQVKTFEAGLKQYLNVAHVITCANGTDALQIAMMALELKQGDEVIVPAFTYAATAEVIGLLGLTPVMVDVDAQTFNITADIIKAAITPRTKAIVPVHLFGQCANMAEIMQVAVAHGLWVIEDTAQAIGALYTSPTGDKAMAGTIGHIGCTSFFPSKNLGCYGDGGAVYTNDEQLAEKMRMIANHGQSQKYRHKYIGVNSRLDSIQAALLNVKLQHLDNYTAARNQAADVYDALLKNVADVVTPMRSSASTHVFHQYTLLVKNNRRDVLKAHLQAAGIPSMIYYPIPLYEQEAYSRIGIKTGDMQVTEMLCDSVLSLPMHTELPEAQQVFIVAEIKKFFA